MTTIGEIRQLIAEVQLLGDALEVSMERDEPRRFAMFCDAAGGSLRRLGQSLEGAGQELRQRAAQFEAKSETPTQPPPSESSEAPLWCTQCGAKDVEFLSSRRCGSEPGCQLVRELNATAQALGTTPIPWPR